MHNLNRCDNAGKRNSSTFSNTFFAVPTPTTNGMKNMSFVLISPITSTIDIKAMSNLFLKYFSKTNKQTLLVNSFLLIES